ncbi:hypothetical protein Mapa_014969 [Marchantia paleacea]|nr:hypothetical protein Mapa_014969 [Marchantia paleacea]
MSSTGSFWSATYSSLCSQLATSACCASCSNQGPYHRHCGCSLHAGLWKFEGPSSPKCQVKISSKKSRSGMFRSISVQNMGDKSLSASCSPCSSGEIHSPFNESSFETREKLADEECKSSTDDETNLTVTLMEELATLIQVVKEGEMGLEETHGDGNDGLRGCDSKRILARFRMARSVTDLCAYAGPDSKGFPVAAALKIESPRLPRPQVE